MTLDPGYAFDIDVARDLLSVRAIGLWDLATLERYGVDYNRALESYCGRPYRLLVDLRAFSVQSQLVHAAAQRFVARQNPLRTAIVVSESVLQRLQAQRTAAQEEEMRTFAADAIDAARRWLFEPVSVRPIAPPRSAVPLAPDPLRLTSSFN